MLKSLKTRIGGVRSNKTLEREPLETIKSYMYVIPIVGTTNSVTLKVVRNLKSKLRGVDHRSSMSNDWPSNLILDGSY